jgi:hypothetical protein
MLICDKCGAEVPEGSRFCPQCADPITEIDRVAKSVEESGPQVPAEPTAQIKLVCPKCEGQFPYEVMPTKSVYNIRCPGCRRGFLSRVVQVRAKRSRGSKKENKRHFSIRVIDFSGGEDLIEFVNASYADFELRAKDMAVFSYLENKLRIVQNLTIGQYMTVSAPKCYFATYVYGSNSKTVETLRLFRDTVLLASPFLSLCVTTYYRISPVLIKWGSNAALFKTASKVLLNPIVKIATWYLWYRTRAERG